MPDSPPLRPWQAAALAASVLALGVAHQLVPRHAMHAHNLLQHLNFLPLMIAAQLFGWRGALSLSLLVVAVQSPHVLQLWRSEPVYSMDQVLEIPVFALTGVVAGLLSEKERRQRTRLEMTKRQLEEVYQELRQNVEKLRKAERLSAAGQLSAGLAHEIRNPLASISGAAGILRRGNASSENVQACLEIIDLETQRLNRLLSSFLEFARPRPPRFQPVDPHALVDSVLTLARHSQNPARVALRKESPPALDEIVADAEQLKQVLLNLVLNAIEASPEGAEVVVRLESTPALLALSVIDSGAGIGPADLERIFEPFFTTKAHGSGLGLAIAAKIIEQHGGTLSARPNPTRGMTFRAELPVRSLSCPS